MDEKLMEPASGKDIYIYERQPFSDKVGKRELQGYDSAENKEYKG